MDAVPLPRRAEPVYLQIAHAVMREIHRGRFQPGDALPGYRSLAEQLGVSRNTVMSASRARVAPWQPVSPPTSRRRLAPPGAGAGRRQSVRTRGGAGCAGPQRTPRPSRGGQRYSGPPAPAERRPGSRLPSRAHHRAGHPRRGRAARAPAVARGPLPHAVDDTRHCRRFAFDGGAVAGLQLGFSNYPEPELKEVGSCPMRGCQPQ
jgi:hypothetical protein